MSVSTFSGPLPFLLLPAGSCSFITKAAFLGSGCDRIRLGLGLVFLFIVVAGFAVAVHGKFGVIGFFLSVG